MTTLKAMTGSVLAMLPALAAAQTPVPPPVIIPAPAPPVRAMPREAPRESLIGVVVQGGQEILFNRDLRLSGYAGARAEMEVTQADPLCANIDRYSGTQQQTGLRLGLSPRGTSDRFSVDVTWTRPAEGCEAPGTRSAGLHVEVTLPVGQSRTVMGDGGLRVELTRRR